MARLLFIPRIPICPLTPQTRRDHDIVTARKAKCGAQWANLASVLTIALGLEFFPRLKALASGLVAYRPGGRLVGRDRVARRWEGGML
jgi:hypothetical protein